ncbi:5'-methylthioadenosine/adenosylhomocysteine nucleosidase [Paraflavisolibacter sp. H34]|uniref:5'-methylthioadenosine/adenosylhomocysteine nucleosidase n=1 Tax=Huijunlia imazamoxiresistens TaxID=3127457 RepID=UPI003017B72E
MKERRIGIMGAMPEEIEGVVHLLTDRAETAAGRRTYYTGRINGIPAVVVFSRWGKVAAATTVATLIHEFGITDLIFTGVAGALQADLRIGDILIGTRLIQHDMDVRPILPRFETPLLGITWFESPRPWVDLSLKAVNELLDRRHLHEVITEGELHLFRITQPRVFTGAIASGDKFFSRTDDKQQLQELLPEVLCVEMEGAAVAQVCYEYDIPFTIIRTVSDAADDASAIDFPLFIQHISSRYSVEIIRNIFAHL